MFFRNKKTIMPNMNKGFNQIKGSPNGGKVVKKIVMEVPYGEIVSRLCKTP